jgi:hypothetical protein
VNNQSYAVQRSDKRLPLPIPIVVNGTSKSGVPFSEPTETVNVSHSGMGLILKHEPSFDGRLDIVIYHRQKVLKLKAEIRHVTERGGERIVGVKFHRPMEFSNNS